MNIPLADVDGSRLAPTCTPVFIMLSLSRLPRKPAPNRTGLQRRGPGCTHRARLRRRWSKQEVISRATPQLGRYPHCPSDRTRTTTTTSALLVWEPNRPGSCEIFGLRSCGLAGCWIRDRLRVTPTKERAKAVARVQASSLASAHHLASVDALPYSDFSRRGILVCPCSQEDNRC